MTTPIHSVGLPRYQKTEFKGDFAMAKLSEKRLAQLKEAQRKYRENKRLNGQKQVNVWISSNQVSYIHIKQLKITPIIALFYQKTSIIFY